MQCTPSEKSEFMSYYGIDVSEFQGNISWQEVAQEKITFCFVRTGYCENDGTVVEDAYFTQNVEGSTAVGISTGLYLFSYATTPQAARTAAKEFLELAEEYRLTMPLVLDMEDEDTYGALGVQQNTDIAAAFLDEIEEGGYYAMLYTNADFAEEYLDMSQLSAYDFWVADYADSVSYTGSYGIWQYTDSDTVSGISTEVDGDIAYKNYPNIIKNAGLNALSATKTTTDSEGHTTTKPTTLVVGDKVQIQKEAKYYANSIIQIPSWVKQQILKVAQISGNKALLMPIYSWVYSSDLIVVGNTQCDTQ
ncbi:MAG: glycoside hydrolase family 25 protein [Oscillospiraceae bacterium]|nr:glycoside hydrolase family 25 protein [Oscillospiraceae bacterium]